MRWCLFVLVFFVGCNAQAGSDAANIDYGAKSEMASSSHARDGSVAELSSATSVPPIGIGSVTGKAPKSDFDVNRKIIYIARMELVVEEFDGLEKRIQQAIERHHGYLAKVDLNRMQGEQRQGQWTARIPGENYQAFLIEIAELGVPVSQSQDANDVTEDFVDLTARITNHKKLEGRILELLERPDDKIQHVIEVERELARVRQQIEQMEGRLRYLTDKISMTTVNISAREEKNYEPPQAPTFDNRLSAAWSSSVSHSKTTAENALVGLVGNLINLAFFLAAAALFWFLMGRRIWRYIMTQFHPSAENTEPVESTGSATT